MNKIESSLWAMGFKPEEIEKIIDTALQMGYSPIALGQGILYSKGRDQMEGLTEGRIVHYVPTLEDAIKANRRRVMDAGHGPDWPAGAQAHVGNLVKPGQHYPAIVVQVLKPDYLDGTAVNLQVFLDGNDTLWVTAPNSQDPRQMGAWHWIERA